MEGMTSTRERKRKSFTGQWQCRDESWMAAIAVFLGHVCTAADLEIEEIETEKRQWEQSRTQEEGGDPTPEHNKPNRE